MSYFIYTDLISSLLDPKLQVDPGSTLIHVGAYGPNCFLAERTLLYVPKFQRFDRKPCF